MVSQFVRTMWAGTSAGSSGKVVDVKEAFKQRRIPQHQTYFKIKVSPAHTSTAPPSSDDWLPAQRQMLQTSECYMTGRDLGGLVLNSLQDKSAVGCKIGHIKHIRASVLNL